MLRLIRRDMRDGRKDVRTVRRGSLDTVSMIDATFTSFVIDVKVLQIVVKIYGSRAEIASEKGRVGREDGRHVDVAFSAAACGDGEVVRKEDSQRGTQAPRFARHSQRNSQASEPLMEMRYDGLILLICREFTQEPSYEITKDDRLVGFCIISRRRDTC